MKNYNYKELQNGSDIRGISLATVPGEKPNLQEEEAFRLTKGFLKWLSEKSEKSYNQLSISVGHDPRLSSEDLQETVIATLLPFGCKIYDCALASTPAMFMSTYFNQYQCDGAIMITASHLPQNKNGFKYFDRKGGLNKTDISEIIELAESHEIMDDLTLSEATGTFKAIKVDLLETYCDHLRKLIIESVDYLNLKPLIGLKIAVDAGNGSGGFFATKILEPLGADISGSQFLEPDGNFPNHMPNPEDETAMASLSAAVKSSNADLGLIFDTDVDRFAAVDSKGNEINRNKLIALAAALIANDYPNTTVVTDSITSTQLTDFLVDNLNLKHLRFRRGYKNVINKSIELNNSGIDSQLAIETSGHAAYKENFFLDDGAYLAAKIVIKAAILKTQGKTIDSIIKDLKSPDDAIEYRLSFINITENGILMILMLIVT